MNHIRKKFTITALIATFCTPTIMHAWGNCCYVLHDPKTDHIVRLLGDRHACYIDTGKEAETEHEFIENVRIPFENYLQQKNTPEICIVESGGIKPEDLKNIFWCHDLMTHLVVFGYGIDHDTCGILKKPCIPIVSFDFRAYFGLIDFVRDVCYGEFPLDCKEKQKKARECWNSFLSTFSQKHHMYSYTYDTTIKQSLDGYVEKICNELPKIEKFFATTIDSVGLHPVRYLKKQYLFIKEKKSFLELTEKFTSNTLADYGFMSCIGKARAVQRNITLYTGSNHTENMFEELKKIGYEVLFSKEKENEGEGVLSKEDCNTFFTIGFLKQPQAQKKSSDLKNMKFEFDEIVFLKSKL